MKTVVFHGGGALLFIFFYTGLLLHDHITFDIGVCVCVRVCLCVEWECLYCLSHFYLGIPMLTAESILAHF